MHHRLLTAAKPGTPIFGHPMDQNDRPADNRMERLGLQPGDYYLTDEGYLVFTEQYLRRRGYCCGNACRHCPYGHVAVRNVQG